MSESVRRVLAGWVPDWPVVAVLGREPEPQCLAAVTERGRILAASGAARAAGVRGGQKLRSAQALVAADETEAEQHYLETVRMSTTFDVGADGHETRAAETDVPGVPGYDGAFHLAYRIDRGTPDTELRSDVIAQSVEARSAQTLANDLLASHLLCPGVEPAPWRLQVWTGTSPEEAGTAMRSGRPALAIAQRV
ncbi:hypothetical protein KAURM247S_04444 [Kitasatospora aureofaciens]